jgi:hypothetical protein
MNTKVEEQQLLMDASNGSFMPCSAFYALDIARV